MRRAAWLAALAVLVVWGRAHAADNDGLAPQATAPLVDKAFQQKLPFCHDPKYPLTGHEQRWCELLPRTADGQPDPRCPRLTEICKRPAAAEVVGRHRRGLLSGEAPHVPMAIVWVLLAAGVAFVLYRLFGQALALAPAATTPAKRSTEEAPDERAIVAARAVETDVQRLLARARAAAGAGDFSGGVADAYAALLRRLEGAGVVRVEAARTNGEHLREVRRKLPAAHDEMRAVVRVVEEVQFSDAVADEGRFRLVLDGVVRLLGERFPSAAHVLVLGVALLGAATGCGLERDSWDDSPSGQGAVMSFLRSYGFQAHERLSPLSKVDEAGLVTGNDQLVLLPDAEIEQADWARFNHWVRWGGTLIVVGGHALPDWIPAKIAPTGTPATAPLAPAKGVAEWYTGKLAIVPPGARVEIGKVVEAPAPAGEDEDEDEDEDEGEDENEDEDDQAAEGDGQTRDEVEQRSVSAEEAIVPLEGLWPLVTRGDDVYIAEGELQAGKVVLVADERLFTNAALLVADNATMLADLLRRRGARVEVVGALTGLVSTSPLQSVSRGRLAPALIQLAVVVLLFFLYRGAHFGRPNDPVTDTRRAFAQHARAVGLQYGRAHAGRHALVLYGAFALERLRDRLRLGGRKGLSEVAEAIAVRTGRPLGEVMRLLVEVRPDEPVAPEPARPANTKPAAVAAADLTALREIAKLLAETGGAGERSRVQGQG